MLECERKEGLKYEMNWDSSEDTREPVGYIA
jgi:hypothetical protein